MKNREPWPERYIQQRSASSELAGLFKATLADATDEAPLQTVLVSSPVLLRPLAPPVRDAWLFDRPRFGSEFIPDFLLCTRASTGMEWILVELESPQTPILTKAGRPAAKLNEALSQVRDWRGWLRDNISYARNELGFVELHAECRAYVVIGRRNAIESSNAKRYKELSTNDTLVMTYDRLVEMIDAAVAAEA